MCGKGSGGDLVALRPLVGNHWKATAICGIVSTLVAVLLAGGAGVLVNVELNHGPWPRATVSSTPSAIPSRLLLTGWGPFLNFTYNPSEAVARRLDEACFEARAPWGATTSVCIDSLVLAVNRTGVLRVTQLLDEKVRGMDGKGITSNDVGYDGIVHLGLENSWKGLRLEVAASNQEANDTGGPSTRPAIPGAPSLLPTTVDIGRLSTDGLLPPPSNGTHGAIPPVWSRDAGDYYCNELLYRSLEWVRSRNATVRSTGQLIPAMFIHLPNSSVESVATDAALVQMILSRIMESTMLVSERSPPSEGTFVLDPGMVAFAALVAVLAVPLATLTIALFACTVVDEESYGPAYRNLQSIPGGAGSSPIDRFRPGAPLLGLDHPDSPLGASRWRGGIAPPGSGVDVSFESFDDE